MKKILYGLLGFLVLLLLLALIFAQYHRRDRNPGYSLNLRLPAAAKHPVSLQVGISRRPITPQLPDTWVDADSNGRYEPDQGDRYIDQNGNGQFDAFWLAGFHNNRPAVSVHDDLWARVIVMDDGATCIALAAIDAIGFFHDDVIDVRKQVKEKPWPIDHVIICATHNHETPDLMGLWGPTVFRSGVNKAYRRFVKTQIVQAIADAYGHRQPATLLAGRIDSTARDLVRDTRPPRVLDDAIHLLQFRSVATDSLLGLLLNWGDHPETLASENLQITADFCHYWLFGIEQGIIYDDQVKRAGLGGIAVFANGCVGGLMTTLGYEVHDPWLNKNFKKPSFDKARAQGFRLADKVLDHVANGPWEKVDHPQLGLYAQTFSLPVKNNLFNLGGALKVLDRGFSGWNKVRSEINLVTIGDAVSLLMLPGEIYPEIVNGGVDLPQGSDLGGPVIEKPALRELMPGRFKLVIGLANDEVGYVLPKSQWDVEKPYTYNAKKAPYGEINSLGPNTGPIIYTIAKGMIEQSQPNPNL